MQSKSVRLPSSVDLDAYASEQWEVQAFSLHSCFLFKIYIDTIQHDVLRALSSALLAFHTICSLGMFWLFKIYDFVTPEFSVAPYKLRGS